MAGRGWICGMVGWMVGGGEGEREGRVRVMLRAEEEKVGRGWWGHSEGPDAAVASWG